MSESYARATNDASWVRRNRNQLGIAGRLLLAFVALVFALTPVLLVVTSSIDPRNTLTTQSFIPTGASLDNYEELFTSEIHPYGTWFWNTMKIAITTSVLTVLICSISAFAFSRFRFRGRRGRH